MLIPLLDRRGGGVLSLASLGWQQNLVPGAPVFGGQPGNRGTAARLSLSLCSYLTQLSPRPVSSCKT